MNLLINLAFCWVNLPVGFKAVENHQVPLLHAQKIHTFTQIATLNVVRLEGVTGRQRVAVKRMSRELHNQILTVVLHDLLRNKLGVALADD